MIKPTSLWNFIYECEIADAEYIGRICLALANKPGVPMSRAERIQYLAIKKDNADMDERIEDKRNKDRKRQAERRKFAASIVAKARASRDVAATPREFAESASPYIRPSVHPSVHPSSHKTDPNPIPITRTRGSESALRTANGSSRIAGTAKPPDPWTMTDDDIRYGTEVGTEAILSIAFGKGGWAKAVAQAGDAALRELFITFRNEIRVGEAVDEPAAAFTARCKRELGVDFRLSLAESVKAGKSAGVR